MQNCKVEPAAPSNGGFIARITKCILLAPVSPGQPAAAPVLNANADEFNPLVQVQSPVVWKKYK